MRIGLIDVDSHKFPNLALMKLSAYHKLMGDSVEWYTPFGERYDVVFMSKVFSFTPDYDLCINSDLVVQGGTGYCITLENGKEVFDKGCDFLPQHIEHIYPDYSLYNITDTAYGFLTRGCPRGCEFCIVGKKEGKVSYKVANLSEFWNGQKNIVLCDPNILACKDWKDLFQQLIDSKAYVDFNQGLDIRLMTEKKAEMLNQIKIKEIHFAWDRYEDKDLVLEKLKLYSEVGKFKKGSHNVIVYTIVNFDTTFEQKYKDLQRWVNNRVIFAKCDRFEDYKSGGG